LIFLKRIELRFFFRHPIGRGKAENKSVGESVLVTSLMEKINSFPLSTNPGLKGGIDFLEEFRFFFNLSPEKVEGGDGNEKKYKQRNKNESTNK